VAGESESESESESCSRELVTASRDAVPSVISNPYNQHLLKAMMALAYYCFRRIGEIAVKSVCDHHVFVCLLYICYLLM
jgi:hypothetical protein